MEDTRDARTQLWDILSRFFVHNVYLLLEHISNAQQTQLLHFPVECGDKALDSIPVNPLPEISALKSQLDDLQSRCCQRKSEFMFIADKRRNAVQPQDVFCIRQRGHDDQLLCHCSCSVTINHPNPRHFLPKANLKTEAVQQTDMRKLFLYDHS